jgi:hypothetical protein
MSEVEIPELLSRARRLQKDIARDRLDVQTRWDRVEKLASELRAPPFTAQRAQRLRLLRVLLDIALVATVTTFSADLPRAAAVLAILVLVALDFGARTEVYDAANSSGRARPKVEAERS